MSDKSRPAMPENDPRRLRGRLKPVPMIVLTALTLAVRLTTNRLVGTELGRLKRLLAIAAVEGMQWPGSSKPCIVSKSAPNGFRNCL